MMPSQKKKTAFSLFELSIVILIIALILGGVLEGRKLILESRLVSAQRLTLSSEIEKISDMVAWFETSLPESFDNIFLEDGTPIATWHDRAVDNVDRHNALQNNLANQPIFINHIINQALPALQFDGTRWMSFANTDLNNSSYTIFVVEQRNSGGAGNYFIGSEGGGNANFYGGYLANNVIIYKHGVVGINFNVQDYSPSQDNKRIHTFLFKSGNLMSYFSNGGLTSNSDSTAVDSVTGMNEIIIGASQSNVGRYSGYIAEVILFKRNLLTEERRQIEAYLSRKYNITID